MHTRTHAHYSHCLPRTHPGQHLLQWWRAREGPDTHPGENIVHIIRADMRGVFEISYGADNCGCSAWS